MVAVINAEWDEVSLLRTTWDRILVLQAIADGKRASLRTNDVSEAVEEICGFYDNYHSQRFIGDRLVLRLTHAPTAEQLERLNDTYGDLLASGTIEAAEAAPVEIEDDDHPELPRLRLHFDRRSLGRLRSMIDDLNAMAPLQE